MGLEVFAIQQLALATIVTRAAQLGIICRHLVTKLEALDRRAHLDDDAGSLVARHYGLSDAKVAVVDVKVRSTDTT